MSMTRAEHTLDLCRVYLDEFGWAIFPMFGVNENGCECGNTARCVQDGTQGKHPNYHLAPNGLKNATNYIEEVELWLEEYPNSNIAVATGATSNICVIDVDWYEDKAADTYARLFDQLYPYDAEALKRGDHRTQTRAVISGGGGFHLYYEWPGVKVKNVASHKRIGPGVDIRGDGGSAILPPSVSYKTGALYQWDGDGGGMYRPLDRFPEGVLARLQFEEPRIDLLPHNRGANPFRGKREPMREPGRNNALTRIAGGIHAGGASREELRGELHKINRESCIPPLAPSEVDAIVNSVSNYPR